MMKKILKFTKNCRVLALLQRECVRLAFKQGQSEFPFNERDKVHSIELIHYYECINNKRTLRRRRILMPNIHVPKFRVLAIAMF